MDMLTSYPKTATSCCICGKSFKSSAELYKGIDLQCQEKYKYNQKLEITPEQAQKILGWKKKYFKQMSLQCEVSIRNRRTEEALYQLIYIASAEKGTIAAKIGYVLKLMGYEELGMALLNKHIGINVTEKETAYEVLAWQSQRFEEMVEQIPGLKSEGDLKFVPKEYKQNLWNALISAFPGQLALTSKGLVELKEQ